MSSVMMTERKGQRAARDWPVEEDADGAPGIAALALGRVLAGVGLFRAWLGRAADRERRALLRRGALLPPLEA